MHDDLPVEQEPAEGLAGGRGVVLDAGLDVDDVGHDLVLGRQAGLDRGGLEGVKLGLEVPLFGNLLDHKPRALAGSLPPSLVGLGDVGRHYFKLFAASSRSVYREIVRLTLLVELFGESTTASAIDEVMRTGHVGAEYVEYVLRHKRGLAPHPPPLRLGHEQLDAISLREPDLGLYDQLVSPPLTRDPGPPLDGEPGQGSKP